MKQKMVGLYCRVYPDQSDLVEKVASERNISAAELIRQIIDLHLRNRIPSIYKAISSN